MAKQTHLGNRTMSLGRSDCFFSSIINFNHEKELNILKYLLINLSSNRMITEYSYLKAYKRKREWIEKSNSRFSIIKFFCDQGKFFKKNSFLRNMWLTFEQASYKRILADDLSLALIIVTPIGSALNIAMILVFTRKKFHSSTMGLYYIVSSNALFHLISCFN